jgi:hypothetical protein
MYIKLTWSIHMMSLKERQKLAGMKSAELLKKQKEQRIEEYNKNPKLCIECSFPITYEKRVNKFCSHSCSATRTNKQRAENGWKLSDEARQKLKVSGKKYGRLGGLARSYPPKIETFCKICNKSVFRVKSLMHRKYCSRKCASSDPALYKNYGGYRRGSGYSKSGYYNGIYCQSTYELCWVIWATDNGIKFSRFKGVLEGQGLKYIPDFILADNKTIIELKGYEHDDSVNKKTHLAESLGYIVNVLRKQDLSHVFDYVKNTYQTSKFETLYDVIPS